MSDCIFCRIVAGEVPARVIYDDGTAIAPVVTRWSYRATT
jgi:diadenosine tetraphosphate (Ap4A) HIT family hydrolase